MEVQALATLAFAFIAGPAGFAFGPVGTALMTGLGAVLDSTVVFPQLFGPEPVVGPRLGDLNLAASGEGSPVYRMYGPNVRVPGTLLWMSPIKEIISEEDVDGKGGTGGESLKYQYFASAQIGFGRRTISKYKEVYFDGKLNYDESPDISLTSDNITADIKEVQNLGASITEYLIFKSPAGDIDLSEFKSGKPVTVSGFTGADAVNNGTWKVVTAKIPDPLSGISTLEVKNTPGYTGFKSVPTPGDTVTFFQEQPTFSLSQIGDIRFYTGTVDQPPDPLIVAFEDPDGLGLVPAFRGYSHIVLEDLNLKDYGNRFPNIEALIEADSSPAAAPIIAKILRDAGLTEAQYDVSGVTGEVEGFIIRGPQKTAETLQPILIAENLVVAQEGPKIIVCDRLAVPVVELDPAEFGCDEPGTDRPRPFTVSDSSSLRLPRHVTVTHLDPARDFQSGSQRSPDIVEAGHEVPGPVNFDTLVMSADKARTLANRLLWDAWASRQSLRIYFSPKYLNVREGMRIDFTSQVVYSGSPADLQLDQQASSVKLTRTLGSWRREGFRADELLSMSGWGNANNNGEFRIINVSHTILEFEGLNLVDEQGNLNVEVGIEGVQGVPWKVLVRSVEMGSNYVSFLEGRVEDPDVHEQTLDVLASAPPSGGFYGAPGQGILAGAIGSGMTGGQPGVVFLTGGDLPPLSDDPSRGGGYATPGIIVAGKQSHPWIAWRGAYVYISFDEGLNWRKKLFLADQAIAGSGVTDGDDLIAVAAEVWDEVNTLRVEIPAGMYVCELESKTEDQVLDGANRILWGKEIIGFRTATLVETNSYSKIYDLTGLLRGLADTGSQINTQEPGAQFLYLNGPGIYFLPLNLAAVGKTIQVGVVPAGATLAEIDVDQLFFTAKNLRPFAVSHLEAVRDGSDNIAITWQRRTRAVSRAFLDRKPRFEEEEMYEIDFYEGGGSDVLRTVTTTTPTVTYTAAEQTADGLTPGDPVDALIYQISGFVGRGNESELLEIP